MYSESKWNDYGKTTHYKASVPSRKDVSLNIIHMIGYHKVNDRYGITRKQGHPTYLLLLTVGGEGTVTIGQSRYAALPGTAILIPPNLPNAYCTVQGGLWEFYWIHYTGRIAGIYSEDLIRNRAFSAEIGTDPIREWIDAYLAVDPYSIGREYDISELLSRFLGSLLKCTATSEYTEDERSIVTEMIKDFSAGESPEFSLNSFADRYHYSKEYIIRLFKNAVGIPPYRYFLLLRLERSCAALCSSNQPIEQIAKECGYQSLGSYSKQFKKYYRLSPSEYRRVHKVGGK